MVRLIENGKRQLLIALVWGCLSACAVAVGLLYYWMFFDVTQPVEVVSAQPLEPAFPVGEPIVIDERIVVRRHCPGAVNRYIVDGASIAYPILLPNDPLLGTASDRLRIEFQMPQHLGPGRYRYRSEAVWQCNPLRIIRQPIVDVPFMVVKPAPAPEAQ